MTPGKRSGSPDLVAHGVGKPPMSRAKAEALPRRADVAGLLRTNLIVGRLRGLAGFHRHPFRCRPRSLGLSGVALDIVFIPALKAFHEPAVLIGTERHIALAPRTRLEVDHLRHLMSPVFRTFCALDASLYKRIRTDRASGFPWSATPLRPCLGSLSSRAGSPTLAAPPRLAATHIM